MVTDVALDDLGDGAQARVQLDPRKSGTSENEEARRGPAPLKRSGPLGGRLLVVPTVLTLGVAFLLPLTMLVRMSLKRIGEGRSIEDTWSFDTFRTALTDGFVWDVVWNTARLGALVTVLTLMLSYPIAIFLVRTTSRYKGLLVALAVAPMLTSQVIRTYGWMILLGDQGFINGILQSLGLRDTPLRLMYNELGVVIALAEILMPYAILTMIAGFGRLDRAVEEAAASLGASPARVFIRVTLPLTVPGVAVAAIIVFILTISSFVPPDLIGGGKVFVLATEIYSDATTTLNWPMAAALAMLLMGMFVALAGCYTVAARRSTR